MIKPRALQKGSKVGIVATARAAFRKDLLYAVNWLKNCGYEVSFSENIDETYHQFAGDDKLRIDALQKMINDSSVDAIWFAKGGYGSVRVIDHIDFENLKKKPKWFIGYSDPTVFHLYLHRLGMMSIHGAMPVGLADKSKNTRVYLNDILRGEPQNYQLENKMPLNRDGYAEGKLIGGNLSVIYSVIGSSSSLMSDDKILFLEDLDEYLYHLDRMMMSLKRNGIFDKIKGLIIGSFSNMNDNEISFGKSAYEIIFDVVKVYDFPVYFGFPAGHQKDNFPLLFGNHVEMKLNQGQFQLNLKNGCA